MAYDIILGREKKDVEKYGTRGTVLLGKSYVKMGQTTSLSNPIHMDLTKAHVMLICGKRGSGKCITGDSLITLEDGRELPIQDLEHNTNDIFTINDELKIQNAVKTNFFTRTVNKVVHITLRTGKKITLTPEHPLLTIKGWTEAQDLLIGSRIATPRIIPHFGRTDISEEKIKLLAYLLAEGHLGNNFILFSNTDASLVQDFTNAVRVYDSRLFIKQHKESCYRVVSTATSTLIRKGTRNKKGQFIIPDTCGNKNSLITWMRTLNLYNTNSHTKFIPDCIFTAPKHEIALFLNRLFSCDGSIYCTNNYYAISYSSVSLQLIQQVQSLLLRFGIVAKLRHKQAIYKNTRRPAYELVINGEFVTIYLQEIGFYGTKQQRATRALQQIIHITRNPNMDTIPKEIWELYTPQNWAAVGRTIGYKHPKALRESTRYSPSRQKLLTIAKADNQQILEHIATSDLFWDEIITIEEKTGTFTVYDLTIPGHHNFVANNIIVHNSYCMGAIAEGLATVDEEIKQNLSLILLDTMGIYWTMKYGNTEDPELMKQWGLTPQGLDVKIFTPESFYYKYKQEGIPTDYPFTIQPTELGPDDWNLTFELEPTDPIAIFIERIVLQLREKNISFDLDDMITECNNDTKEDQHIKQAAINRFTSAKAWGIFSKHGTPLKNLAMGGQVTVLDVSCYAVMPNGWKIKSLVVGLLCQKIFTNRMLARKDEEFLAIQAAEHYLEESKKEEKKMPLVWIVIDEAHEFLPIVGKTAASSALITLLREGRQPGISLILATQQPGKIHTDVMTQSDILLSLRLTAKLDTDSLGALMQSYMRTGLDKLLGNLPHVSGAALVLDDTNERIFSMRVRPRITRHGGSSPSALIEKKKLYEF